MEKRLADVRQEFARLKQDFAQGRPVADLIAEARAVLKLPDPCVIFEWVWGGWQDNVFAPLSITCMSCLDDHFNL